MARLRALSGSSTAHRPSWWVVLVAGGLVVVFSVAIVRELINGYTVRQQVKRLRGQVATEQHRQQELQDLIAYLSSPTFQEREARLQLGLKKSDEQVVVVPDAPGEAGNVNAGDGSDGSSNVTAGPTSNPQRWWNYFFGTKHSST
jgi:hypothetical protein